MTMKFPSDLPPRRGRHAPTSSAVAVAGKGQHQDTGAKAIHLAPNTRSRIVSQVRLARTAAGRPTAASSRSSPGATNVVASVRCDALMLDDQSRSDTYPYIDIQEDDTTMTHEATVGKVSADQVFYLMSRGLTENEAHEPHRPGLPRGLHEGTPDGVRHRVQPPREAGDGGVARVTSATEPGSAEAHARDTAGRPARRGPGRPAVRLRRRRARRGPGRRALRAGLARAPSGSPRAAAYDGAAGRVEPALHDRTSTCAPPTSSRSGRTSGPRRSAPARRRPPRCPTASDGLLELREDGVAVLALSAGRDARPGVDPRDVRRGLLARDPDRAPRPTSRAAPRCPPTTSSPS